MDPKFWAYITQQCPSSPTQAISPPFNLTQTQDHISFGTRHCDSADTSGIACFTSCVDLASRDQVRLRDVVPAMADVYAIVYFSRLCQQGMIRKAEGRENEYPC